MIDMRNISSIFTIPTLGFLAFGCVHGQSGVDRDEELVKAEKHNLLCKEPQQTSKKSIDAEDQVTTKRAGGLKAREIMTVIKANLDDVKKCYESVLGHNAKVRGKATLYFVIGKSGKVQEGCFYRDSELIAASLYHCIVEDMKDWNFPKPSKGAPVEVTYPFVFKPS